LTVFFFQPEGQPGTFDKDELLPPLPLPKLEDTLARYYEGLKPFASQEELKHTKSLLDKFSQNEGRQLQDLLEAKARNAKNWVEQWWEDYAYLTIRTPLLPYCLMGTTVPGEAMNVPETPENFLKTAALALSHSLVYWQVIHNEKIRPATNPSGTVTFSMAMLKRLYNTVRLPGKEIDEIQSYFKTKSEGLPPSHFVVIARGRFFLVEGLNPDGTTVSAQQLYKQFQIINSTVLEELPKPSVALLTQDERSKWAENRQRIQELSPDNKETLKSIESAIYTLAIDDRAPVTHSEVVQMVLTGGESIWADKSCSMVIHRNGKNSFLGEHSCYDGSISSMSNFFMMLSILEAGETDWDEPVEAVKPPKEVKFELDETLRNEIKRMEGVFEKNKNVVSAVVHTFQGYGKEFMKVTKVHPDSYLQAVIQLTYYKLHQEVVATYETATMREYYHGRTETVRSCNMKMLDLCKTWNCPRAKPQAKMAAFKTAAEGHHQQMQDARKGKGVDRHLFGLYCTALENKLPVPEIFTSDPLFVKSGGGGNFVLSTSTLGYTINLGCVAPMVTDGYGVFYSMLKEACWLMITTYKESTVTSSEKFAAAFDKVMDEVKWVFDHSSESKL